MTLTDEQKLIRRSGLGSTDIGAVVAYYKPELAHMAKYANCVDVWMRIVHGIEQTKSAVMGRGHSVEPKMRQLYRDTIGPVDDPPGTLRHPQHAWAVGSPDGRIGNVLVEFKSASIWTRDRWGEPGSDKCPDSYSLQVQWLMEIAQCQSAHVLVGFGQDFKNDNGEPDFAITETAVYLIPKDEALIASMLDCGKRFFHDHIIPRVAPSGLVPVNNRRAYKRLVNERATVSD